jgi:hypothetical protein
MRKYIAVSLAVISNILSPNALFCQGNGSPTLDSNSRIQGNGASTGQPQAKKGAPKSGQPQAANQAGYSPNDVVGQKIVPQKFAMPSVIPTTCGEHKTAADLFGDFITNQQNAKCILDLFAAPVNTGLYGKNNAVMLHVVIWNSQPKYRPRGGAWGFYRISGSGALKQNLDLSGTPYFYDSPQVLLVDLNYFDGGLDQTKGTLAYDIKTLARQKQDTSDAQTLLSSFLKVSAGATPSADLAPKQPEIWGTVSLIQPTTPVPYDIATTVTFNAPNGTDSSTVADCSPSPCSFSKTVTHFDTEYWDVSLGLAIPGPIETTYKESSANGSSATLTPSKVTHTDAYAFIDIYPFQHFADAPAMFSAIPHVNFGLPISSQVMHRPYAGIAENLAFLTSRMKLNIPLSVYAGVVIMKQQVAISGLQSLKWDRATKMMFGLELPIGSITKYMKGSGGNNTTANKSAKTQPSDGSPSTPQLASSPSADIRAVPEIAAPAASPASPGKGADTGASQELFEPPPPQADETPEQAALIQQLSQLPTTKSVQVKRVNSNALRAGEDVSLSFEGWNRFALLERNVTVADSRDFSWAGASADADPSDSTFVSANGEVAGSIVGPQGILRIVPLGRDLQAVVEVDPTKFPKDDPPLPHSADTRPPASGYKAPRNVRSSPLQADTSMTTIDVLVAYTPLAKRKIGNTDLLTKEAIEESNQSYLNSGIAIHLNLVDTLQVNYVETGRSYPEIQNDFVGMTDVNSRRDQSGADLAVLLVDQPDYCGMADPQIPADVSRAFAVVYWNCIAGYYSFAHELGHLMGARHDETDDPTTQPFPYGHGFWHLSPGASWRTIMADPCSLKSCTRIQYWSNPLLTYKNQPLGTVNTNDNARVLNENRTRVAAFRNRPTQ